MLLGAIGLSLILLALEHLVYFVIVPAVKARHPDGVCFNRNVEYFSQVQRENHSVKKYASVVKCRRVLSVASVPTLVGI